MDSELKNFSSFSSILNNGHSVENNTFSEEDKLPSLPIPDLNKSLDLYLDSAMIYLSSSEYHNTINVVEEFRHHVGHRLQTKLQERARNTQNWLTEWWEEFAYLRDREPLMPGANVCGPCPFFFHYWPPKEGSQLFRAAVILNLTTEIRQHIRAERLLIEKRSDGSSLSMTQSKRVFNGSREPNFEKDRLLNFFQTETENSVDEYSYVVVICNGHIYRLEVIDTGTNQVKSIPELHLQLERIEAMSSETPGCDLPRLTTLNRSSWAECHQKLRSLHKDNSRSLEIIDRAAFCLTLDGSSPNTPDEIVELSLRAGEGVVWADKTYSIVVCRNGIVTLSSDHCQVDAMAMFGPVMYCDFNIYKTEGYSAEEKRTVESPESIPSPTELVFVVDAFIKDQINISREIYTKASQNIVAKLPRFHHWGRRQMKTFSVHPDTAVQLALQLAYFRLHGKPAPTYETATTRRFRHGRTETIRSCTREAVNWCRAMLEPGCVVEEKLRLFSLAHMKHNELRKACENGQGCDRHLLGLACIAISEQMPTPEIFKDPAWVKSGGSGNFVLSTSYGGSGTVVGGVKPMTKDGYGCFYRIGFDIVEMVVTSFRDSTQTNCDQMIDSIDVSMKEILELLRDAGEDWKSRL